MAASGTAERLISLCAAPRGPVSPRDVFCGIIINGGRVAGVGADQLLNRSAIVLPKPARQGSSMVHPCARGSTSLGSALG